ncbi:MAG: M48 family metalloprotease [Corynebacteriales bacterium]|nr:M48 family metalloprotease [Mycobacteriales bacterium]
MSASRHNRLAAARRELVDQTVAESVHELGGHLPPPAVEIVSDGKSEGRFNLEHNRVEIRTVRFLGDPSVSDGRIRAAVAHEMGHWSDPTAAARARQIGLAWMTARVFMIVCVAGMVVALVIGGHDSKWPAVPAAAAIAVFVAAFGFMARLNWACEYFADAAATRVVGVAAVIEMVETFPPGRFSHTHPRPEDRIRRLRKLTGTPRDDDS